VKAVILLVEDHEASRRTYARLLAIRGYEVMEAADGEKALNLLDQYKFNLVITDLAMPKVTGFGLLIQMRVKCPDIPVILVTGYLSPHAAETILHDNVKFLSKPVDSNELIATVERLTSPGK
jgi:DNA-binding NtrC family response regulator